MGELKVGDLYQLSNGDIIKLVVVEENYVEFNYVEYPTVNGTYRLNLRTFRVINPVKLTQLMETLF